MRGFFRYVFRSSEGFRDYLMFMGAVAGGLFAVHMIMLITMAIDNITGSMISMYELPCVCAAGFGCAAMADRLLRVSVSFSLSRKSYLRGMLCVLPVLMLITTAGIQLVFMLTDGIFRLAGRSLDCLSFEMTYIEFAESSYQPRIFILNLTVVFCLCMLASGAALLYTGAKNRFNRIAGAIAAGLYCIFCYHRFLLASDNDSGFLHYFIESVLYDEEAIRPADFMEMILESDCFSLGILMLIALTAVWYLLIYAVFAMLTKRAGICGKEQEGQI